MRRDALERLAALRDESQLDAEMVCAEAPSVRRGLHDLARARDADLLVIAASRQDEIYRDLVADDARDCLRRRRARSLSRQSDITIAAVHCVGSASPMTARQQARALDAARTLAADEPTKLSAFHEVSGPGRIEDTVDDEVAHALERIAKLGGVDGHAEYGEAAAELRRYGRSVDLLVLGSHEHSPLGRLLGQGTAQRPVDEPPCPLLVVEQD